MFFIKAIKAIKDHNLRKFTREQGILCPRGKVFTFEDLYSAVQLWASSLINQKISPGGVWHDKLTTEEKDIFKKNYNKLCEYARAAYDIKSNKSLSADEKKAKIIPIYKKTLFCYNVIWKIDDMYTKQALAKLDQDCLPQKIR